MEKIIEQIKKAKNKKGLVLSFQKIQKLPEEISELTHLKKLDLRFNDLIDISPLKYLTELEYLDLSENKIENIDALENLKKLHTLVLDNNKVKTLPSWIVNRRSTIVKRSFDRLGYFYFKNNPIENPPIEIVNQGHSTIKRYFEELNESGIDYIYEAKMLLVGEAKVGKTSVIRKLHDRKSLLPTDEERTRGIDITKHSFKGNHDGDFHINIWDFAGQEKLHATHRFFLTTRSLYVLLTSTDINDDNFDYWIPNIRLFGQNSPILVVKNFKSGFNNNCSILRFIEKGFNLPRNLIEVDIKNCDNRFENLVDAIYSEIQKLPQIGQQLPKAWVRVRKALVELAINQEWIWFNNFVSICKKNGIIEEIKIKDLGCFFHELGVILWYNNLSALKDKIILKPEWATNAVYKIEDWTNNNKRNGEFDKNDVVKILSEESYRNMHDEMIELMKAFRLCYMKRNSRQFIIPSLLPPDPIKFNWNFKGTLMLKYKYAFMPKGIVNQVSAELHKYIKNEYCIWGRGVILHNSWTEALITEDWSNKELNISVKGIDAKSFLGIIMHEIQEINDNYGGIEYIRLIPCSCTNCISSENPNTYKYERLIQKLNEGKSNVSCFESDESVSIDSIFNYIGINKLPQKNISRIKISAKTKLKILIAKNDLDSVFKNLLSNKIISSSKKNKIVILFRRYNSLNGEKLIGALSKDEIDIEENRITKGLLTLIDEIDI